jgi:hypothetical protein
MTQRRVLAGPLLVIVGIVCWALYVKQSHSQAHAYSHGANPPSYVRLVAGHTYQISIHDGVRRETELGVDPAALQCTAARPGQAPGPLRLTVEDSSTTKATNQIASFVSSITGSVQVQCAGFPAVYVDDAADASYDWSGAWLVLASLALLAGLPLTLSLLRKMSLPREESLLGPPGEYDHIQ